jgi:glycosyltransferase involved in cell wall biosynthesis
VFHVLDHSYAHLARYLPKGRAVVTCHDLDMFRSVMTPPAERRGRLFRSMARHVLSGLARAGRVACDSGWTRDELLKHWPALASRTSVIHLGVDKTYYQPPDGAAFARITDAMGRKDQEVPEVLNVGSTVARKRIDFLLRILAAARDSGQPLRLLRVGGAMTVPQASAAKSLGVSHAIADLPPLSFDEMRAIYRRARVLLITSEREGFCLPVVEAMASGTPVIMTDIPVLREIGGEAGVYCSANDVGAWLQALRSLLHEAETDPAAWRNRRMSVQDNARKFQWGECARKYVNLYSEVLTQAVTIR